MSRQLRLSLSQKQSWPLTPKIFGLYKPDSVLHQTGLQGSSPQAFPLHRQASLQLPKCIICLFWALTLFRGSLSWPQRKEFLSALCGHQLTMLICAWHCHLHQPIAKWHRCCHVHHGIRINTTKSTVVTIRCASMAMDQVLQGF
jgi:hypothetical protein